MTNGTVGGALQLSKNIAEFEKRVDLSKLNSGIGRIFDKNKQIRPGFSKSWLDPLPPSSSEGMMIKEFVYPNHSISLYQMMDGSESLLFLKTREYELIEPYLKLLELARVELMEHYPRTQQLTSLSQAGNYVKRYCQANLYNLAKKYEINIGKTRKEEVDNIRFLSTVLAQYTAGMGILEPLLTEGFIQDIYIDSPVGINPVYVTISKLDERLSPTCITNITLGPQDSEGLLSRFRYISGRPFSEANPLLECDLAEFKSRVTIIGPPLSPEGIAFAIRRHSTEPWTLPKLIEAGSLTPLCAGLLSFLIAGKSTIIVAGSRGSGKTSMLGAVMLEFPKTQRVLTIEDTLELPGEQMRELGYKVQSIQVGSSVGSINEMTADDALRVALRLGESALVLGEVRGEETKTLYEAMSAGTAGSSVLGTFHANSAQAVYKRVVSDMGIPAQSFAATDVVLVAGLIQPQGVNRKTRRVTQVSEYVKDAKDPGRFTDLLLYDNDTDSLAETREFSYHSERISAIAHSWDMTVEQALENIKARAQVIEHVVTTAGKENKRYLLGADWVVRSNAKFEELIGLHAGRKKLDHKKVVKEWMKWFEENKDHDRQ